MCKAPPGAAGPVAASNPGSHRTAARKEEGEKEKTDTLQMDPHRKIVSLSVKNDHGIKLAWREGLEVYS